VSLIRNTLHHIATHCNTLQQTANHYIALQHITTHLTRMNEWYQARFISLNPEAMGIREWLIPVSENFEGMGGGMKSWKNFVRSRSKIKFGCRSASESVFVKIFGTFFEFWFQKKRSSRWHYINELDNLENISNWDSKIGKCHFGGQNRDLGDLSPLPLKEFWGNGNGMGIHGEWQTRNDSLTIRECYFRTPRIRKTQHDCWS